jgi:hypothetical protein
MDDILRSAIRDGIAANFVDLLRQMADDMEKSGLDRLRPDDLRMLAQNIEIKYLSTTKEKS